MTTRRMRLAANVLLGAAAALAAVMFTAVPASAAQLGAFEFQPVTLNNMTWVAVGGNGPFKTAFPNGLAFANPNYATNRIPPGAVTAAAPFGSIAAANGGMIRNNTGQIVCVIEIVITNGDTFGNVSAGGGWTATKSVTLDGRAQLHITANRMPEDCLQPGDFMWMRMPLLPQPGGGRVPIVTGQVFVFTPPPGGQQCSSDDVEIDAEADDACGEAGEFFEPVDREEFISESSEV